MRLHHHEPALGRSTAANVGVRLGGGRYVLLHDDDDALAPAFLERTAAMLDAHPDLIGCVSWLWRIEEIWVDGAELEETGRRLFEPEFSNLYLADMAARNRFAPISFLYRRDAFEAAGGYDEQMDLLEDWDFNLRMMMQGDIGVVPEALAYYHIRANIDDDAHRMANTVHAMEPDHWRAHAALLNHHLRADLSAGRFGIGSLMALARYGEPAQHTQASLERMKRVFEPLGLRSLWRSINRK